MPSFEEDALNRAQQMHRRAYNSNQRPNNKPEQTSANNNQRPQEKPEKTENYFADSNAEKSFANQVAESQNDKGMLDILFQNKEQSLILLLVILLMEENSDPTLLLALIYLLM